MDRFAFLSAIIILFSFISSIALCQMVKDGLIANWSFDQSTIAGDTVKDLTGKYDAKMKASPKIVPGVYAEAIQFNGVDSYLELTTLKDFGVKLGTFSIDFWLKTPSTPDWTTLFKTLSDGVTMAWAMDLNRTAKPAWAYVKGNSHFYIRDNGGKALGAEFATDIYDNKWHHIAWVVADSKTNVCQIYVDGKEQAVDYAIAQAPAEFMDFQYSIYLGAANNRGVIERFCSATMDEFRIYNKALTEGEVLRNMASGAAVDSFGKLSFLWGRIKSEK